MNDECPFLALLCSSSFLHKCPSKRRNTSIKDRKYHQYKVQQSMSHVAHKHMEGTLENS